ncbi:MAG TPA: hypothetical protein EYG94_02510 [Campylobacterales bacterium]|nr:hypothetical protein [Campylobacterales bacterium]
MYKIIAKVTLYLFILLVSLVLLVCALMVYLYFTTYNVESIDKADLKMIFQVMKSEPKNSFFPRTQKLIEEKLNVSSKNISIKENRIYVKLNEFFTEEDGVFFSFDEMNLEPSYYYVDEYEILG